MHLLVAMRADSLCSIGSSLTFKYPAYFCMIKGPLQHELLIQLVSSGSFCCLMQ